MLNCLVININTIPIKKQSEKSLLEVEEAKSCIALSLGYITYHLPSDVIASKLESDIIKMFVPLLNGLKVSSKKLFYLL